MADEMIERRKIIILGINSWLNSWLDATSFLKLDTFIHEVKLVTDFKILKMD